MIEQKLDRGDQTPDDVLVDQPALFLIVGRNLADRSEHGIPLFVRREPGQRDEEDFLNPLGISHLCGKKF